MLLSTDVVDCLWAHLQTHSVPRLTVLQKIKLVGEFCNNQWEIYPAALLAAGIADPAELRPAQPLKKARKVRTVTPVE